MIPHELIIIARVLANHEGSDAFLRKAISASYYAMFHTVCNGIADIWYREDTLSRFGADWKHMYRGVNHNAVLRACKDMKLIASLSPEFKLFCEIFLYAYTQRNLADYDPLQPSEKEQVLLDIDRIEEAILAIENADVTHRRAFLSRIVFPVRNS